LRPPDLSWILRELELLKQEGDLLRQRIRNLEALVTPATKPSKQEGCLLCQRGLPEGTPRQCPECDHVFAGKGWEGLDAHWKANHLDVMPYERMWSLMCRPHRCE
jgi:hypothetical protein